MYEILVIWSVSLLVKVLALYLWKLWHLFVNTTQRKDSFDKSVELSLTALYGVDNKVPQLPQTQSEYFDYLIVCLRLISIKNLGLICTQFGFFQYQSSLKNNLWNLMGLCSPQAIKNTTEFSFLCALCSQSFFFLSYYCDGQDSSAKVLTCFSVDQALVTVLYIKYGYTFLTNLSETLQTDYLQQVL